MIKTDISKIKDWIKWATTLLTVAALIFVFQRIWKNQVWTIKEINFSEILLIIPLGGVLFLLISVILPVAWGKLLSWFGNGIQKPQLVYKIYGKSQIAKYIPGNVFQFPGRHIMGLQNGFNNFPLVCAMVYEILGLVASAGIVSALGSVFYPKINQLFTLTAAGLSTFALLSMLFSDRIILWFPFLKKFISPFWLPDQDLKKTISKLLPILGYYVSYFFLTGLVMWLIIIILTKKATIIPLFLVFSIYAIAFLAGFLTPGAPAGTGVRESVMIILMTPFLGEPMSIIVALVARMISIISDCLFYFVAVILPISEDSQKGNY